MIQEGKAAETPQRRSHEAVSRARSLSDTRILFALLQKIGVQPSSLVSSRGSGLKLSGQGLSYFKRDRIASLTDFCVSTRKPSAYCAASKYENCFLRRMQLCHTFSATLEAFRAGLIYSLSFNDLGIQTFSQSGCITVIVINGKSPSELST